MMRRFLTDQRPLKERNSLKDIKEGGFSNSLFRRSSAVERLPVKEMVVGSNPTAGALYVIGFKELY